MRQNNQNKRLRGRGRKGPNPLARSFESNGPDVKIRGTAMHVAEKYQQLARDAAVSGDRIMAENYLQHAEHYSRIVAAAQAHSGGPAVQGRQPNEPDDDDDAEETVAEAPAPTKARIMPEDAPQPFVDRMPGIDTKNGANNGSGDLPARESRSRGNGSRQAGSRDAGSRDNGPRDNGLRENAKHENGTHEAAAHDGAVREETASDAPASASDSGGDGEPPRPRRRARGTRGRSVRRSAATSGADGEAQGGDTSAAEAGEV